jgi:hypothetical protein
MLAETGDKRGDNLAVEVSHGEPPHWSPAARYAGRVLICFPPHELQRKRRPTSGTTTVSAKASTFTSAACPQASHLTITARTPFSRMLASVIRGPAGARALPRVRTYTFLALPLFDGNSSSHS